MRITNGSSVRFHKYDAQSQISTLEVASFRIRNPANTFEYDIVPGAITADRQLNLPVITGTDTLAVLGLAQTFSAAKTFSAGLTTTQVLASADDSGAIGASGTAFSDVFLASGAVINFNAGDVTITHSTDRITVSGGDLNAGSSLTVGDNSAAATSGAIRMVNNQYIVALRAAGGANRQVIGLNASDQVELGQGGIPTLHTADMYGSAGINVKIGATTARATTEPTNSLTLFDGTAPVGTLANGVTIYSTAGEMRVMDSSGTATLLSPHDDEGRWVFDSVDTVTGRRLLIHMEKFMRKLEEHFGWGFIEEMAA